MVPWPLRVWPPAGASPVGISVNCPGDNLEDAIYSAAAVLVAPPDYFGFANYPTFATTHSTYT